MSDTTAAVQLANGLDTFSACENEDHVVRFVCECGRKFLANSDARIGVTRSNANRHAATCPAAIAYVAPAEVVAPAEAPAPAPVAVKLGKTVSYEDAVLTDAGRQAVEHALQLQKAEASLDLTPSGTVAKMVRSKADTNIRTTTDGNWLVAKGGDTTTKETPWALYKVTAKGLRPAGLFPTCVAAFAPHNLA